MNPRLKKTLFHLPPVTRHIVIFLLGLLATMAVIQDGGTRLLVGFENCVLALGFVLIGLTLAVGNIVRGGSKIFLAVECLYLALPAYLASYGLTYYVHYMTSGHR